MAPVLGFTRCVSAVRDYLLKKHPPVPGPRPWPQALNAFVSCLSHVLMSWSLVQESVNVFSHPGFLETASIFSLVAPPLPPPPFLSWGIIANHPENDRVQAESAAEEMGSLGNPRLLFLKTKPAPRQLVLGGRQGRAWTFRTKHRARPGQSGCPKSSWAEAS